MNLQTNISILIAAVLFVITSLVVYMIWRVLTRKQHKEEPDSAKKTESEPLKKGKWGIDKDSYCYPSINDVMGFEFVRVIKVNDDLTQKEQNADPLPDWGTSKGSIGMTTTSTRSSSQETGDDEPFPETNYMQETRKKRQPEMQEDGGDTQQEDDNILHDITQEDLLEAQTTMEWPRNNDNFSTDEEFINIIDQNQEFIEPPILDDDQQRLAREIRSFNNMLGETEKEDFSETIESLLDDENYSEQTEPEEGDSTNETVDFEQDNGYIEENDIPEI